MNRGYLDYRTHIVCIEYAFGEKWGEDTFYFYLNKNWSIPIESICNNGMFSSPKTDDCLQIEIIVMNCGSNLNHHEVHHKDTTFINLMLGFQIKF